MTRAIYAVFSILLYLALMRVSSLLASVNILNSSSQLLLWSLWICVFLISIRIQIKPKLITTLLVSIFLSSSFLFIAHDFFTFQFPSLSDSPTQFILRTYGHNHLGDLAGLTGVLVFIYPFSTLISSILFPFIFIIMAISFSKSAFLGVIAVAAVVALQKKGAALVIFICILIASCIPIAIYTSELSSFPPIASAQRVMKNTLHLEPKSILSVRDSYFSQVFRAWKTSSIEQLLFGYGSGNYIYPSIKTGETSDLTPAETHNIFLSIFIENGALSLFWFVVFCTLIVVFGMQAKSPFLYPFIYLLANFQTDYTYIIPFFIILFFLFAGLSLNSFADYSKKGNKIYILALICIVIFTLFSGLALISIQNNIASLERQLKSALKSNNSHQVQIIITQLEAITPYEESKLVLWSAQQASVGNRREAIRLLDKLSVYSPRWYLLYLPSLLDLMQKEGIQLRKYLETRKNTFSSFPYSEKEKNSFNSICMGYAKMKCIW